MLLLAQSKSFANVINFKYENKPVQFNCAELDISTCTEVLDVKLKNLDTPELDANIQQALMKGDITQLLDNLKILKKKHSAESTMSKKCGSDTGN